MYQLSQLHAIKVVFGTRYGGYSSFLVVFFKLNVENGSEKKEHFCDVLIVGEQKF